MLRYIDANNISNNGANHKSTIDVTKRAQNDTQAWNDFLKAPVGTLLI